MTSAPTTTTTTTPTPPRRRKPSTAPTPAPQSAGLDAQVTQRAFQQALKRVKPAVAKASTLPVLRTVRLEARASTNQLRLVATDLETGIIAAVPATVVQGGAICVPFALLNDVIGALPDAPLQLSVDHASQTLHLRCAPFETTIKGLAAEEFPTLPANLDAAQTLTLDAPTLLAALAQVVPTAAADDVRPALAAVLLQAQDDWLTLVTADGFRLTERQVALDATTEPWTALVPATAMARIAAAIGKADGAVTIAVTAQQSHVVITAPDLTCIARQVEARFPDYRRIIPKQFKTRVVVDRAEFANAVKLASFFARQSANIVKLTVSANTTNVSSGTLTLTANAAETGDNTGVVRVAEAEGDDIQIAFDVRYLAEALSVMLTERVALETTGAQAPGVLRPVADDGQTTDSLLVVLMPMTVR